MSRHRGQRRSSGDDAEEFDDAAFAERDRVVQRAGRRDRKIERTDGRTGRRSGPSGDPAGRRSESVPSARVAIPSGQVPLVAAALRGCGSCRNWMADGMPGERGTCDHPGSGFLHPYSDTPACPFYDR